MTTLREAAQRAHDNARWINDEQAIVTYEDMMNLRTALAEQPAAPAVLTDAEIEAWADGFIRKEAYHRPTAVSLAREAARFVLARAIPPGCVVVKDEPVAWQHRSRSSAVAEWGNWETVGWKPQGPEDARFQMRPLYAARPGAPK